MPPKRPYTSKFKLQLPAGKATPAPPVGPVIGQHGINIRNFCQGFNDGTQHQMAEGLIIPVVCYVFADKTFELEFKTPPASVLIKKELGIEKGSSKSNTEKIGTINRKQLENIATKKMPDLNTDDMDAAVNIIAGTARQMGLNVEK